MVEAVAGRVAKRVVVVARTRVAAAEALLVAKMQAEKEATSRKRRRQIPTR
jgi:hypothetical protein